MSTIAVLIPVLRRPHRVQPLLDSLTASEREHDLVPLFIANRSDQAQRDAVRDADPDDLPLELVVVPWQPGRGDYARKMNRGWKRALELGCDWALLAADDLHFRPGWAEAALDVAELTEACVIGTNDLGNRKVMRGEHATHPLVHRDYAECGTIDDPTRLVHEGYWHNWVDTELVGTAHARGTFAPALDSVVEHLHHLWGKAQDDDVYAIGRAHYEDDRRLYESRRPLWAP